MLTCYDATFLVTKEEVDTISTAQKINVSIHLMVCIHCRRYKHQLKTITSNIKSIQNSIDSGHLFYHLSPDEKANIQQLLENKTKTS
ncbi:MAG: hypothetical protein JXJ22_02945 [Bacteroidales bacterium]|nr:hypothetical protein [Bacteroidales bacterium]